MLAYNPAENAVLVCSNTTNAESAYYELFQVPKNTESSSTDCKHTLTHTHTLSLTHTHTHTHARTVTEGKRSPALTAVWLARNRFAILDKTHQVILRGHNLC